MYRLRVRAGALTAAAFVAAAAITVWLVPPRVAAATSDGVTVSIVQAPVKGCPAPSSATAAYCFQPNSATASGGESVMWTDPTNTSLTLKRCGAECRTSGPGTGADSPFGDSSATLGPQNASYSFTFTRPGTYFYDCAAPTQCAIGEVTVTPAASPTPVQLSAGAGTAPSHTAAPTPTPAPTPSDTPTLSPSPSPSDTSAVALATPTSDISPVASGSFPLVAGGSSGGGSPLVVIVLVILTVVAVGGGVLSFRLFRR
jgi:plastocyanin